MTTSLDNNQGPLRTTTDVGDDKAAERVMAESEYQFRMLADHAPQAIFIQTQLRFAYVNAACVRLYGARSADDLLGKPVTERFHPDFHAAILERVRLLNEEGKTFSQIAQQHLTVTGEIIDVEISAVPFQFKGDNGGLVFVTDITARKKAEEAIRDREQLTATMFAQTTDAIVLVDAQTGRMVDFNEVASRTEQLEKARVEAEAASRAKGAFVANMSHEIRSPMNAIIGFAHLMKRDPLTARQVDYMGKLTVAAQHLLQVINDILDFSKIEAGKMTLEVHDFEPSRVVDYVCSIVAETVAAKDLELLVWRRSPRC